MSNLFWEKLAATLDPLRAQLNQALRRTCQDWELPQEADTRWPDAAGKLHVINHLGDEVMRVFKVQ